MDCNCDQGDETGETEGCGHGNCFVDGMGISQGDVLEGKGLVEGFY